MFLLQVAGAEAVWRCSAERSACRYSGTDLGLGHCGPDGLALRAPLIASACIHARRPWRFWVFPRLCFICTSNETASPANGNDLRYLTCNPPGTSDPPGISLEPFQIYN